MDIGVADHSFATSIKQHPLKDVHCEVRNAQQIREVRDCRHAGSAYRVLGNKTLHVHNNLQQHTTL